jgi:hypothetical protein
VSEKEREEEEEEREEEEEERERERDFLLQAERNSLQYHKDKQLLHSL